MSRGTEKSSLRTLEQKRAKKAWDQVKAVPKRFHKEYRSLVRKVPAMIKMCGLGQTLAFLLSKEEKEAQEVKTSDLNGLKKAEGCLYKHLEEWLLDKEAPIAWPDSPEDQPLMNRIMEVESAVYRQATQEALAYLGWLKRFAEACLEKGGG